MSSIVSAFSLKKAEEEEKKEELELTFRRLEDAISDFYFNVFSISRV